MRLLEKQVLTCRVELETSPSDEQVMLPYEISMEPEYPPLMI